MKETELWDDAIEQAIDTDIARLYVEAAIWEHRSEGCGCSSCKKKAEAKLEETTDAEAHWFYDQPSFEEEEERAYS